MGRQRLIERQSHTHRVPVASVKTLRKQVVETELNPPDFKDWRDRLPRRPKLQPQNHPQPRKTERGKTVIIESLSYFHRPHIGTRIV